MMTPLPGGVRGRPDLSARVIEQQKPDERRYAANGHPTPPTGREDVAYFLGLHLPQKTN